MSSYNNKRKKTKTKDYGWSAVFHDLTKGFNISGTSRRKKHDKRLKKDQAPKRK